MARNAGLFSKTPLQNIGKGGTLSQASKGGVLNGKSIWSATKKRSALKNAYGHWKDHGHEFPDLYNAKQYVEQAHGLFRNPKALSRILASDGSLLRYDLKSNTFGSFTQEGVPRTMFRPQPGEMPSRYSTPVEYFYGQ